jgi:hypothetical protein
MPANTVPARQMDSLIRGSEGWFLTVWLPLSLIAAALLGFNHFFDAQKALATLPGVPLILSLLFLRGPATGVPRTFVLFLLPYLGLEWIAEIYYLSFSLKYGADPNVPSIADLCWLSSYVFLILGCWRVAAAQRGVRLQAKDAFVHGLWLAVSAVVLGLWIYRLVAGHRPLAEALVMGLYPFLDCVIISLLLIIRSRHLGNPLRPLWTVLSFACVAVLAGDVLWLMSRLVERPNLASSLANFGDTAFIQAYLLFTAAIWIAKQLVLSADSETRVRRELRRGSVNVLASVPIVLLLVSFTAVEKGVEIFVHPMSGTGSWSIMIAFVIALGVKGGTWRWEKRGESYAMYRSEFKNRFKDGFDLSPDDLAFLDKFREALHLSSAEARTIEGRVLEEKEQELRAKLEALQRDMLERRSAEEWQTTKAVWLESIKDLHAQIAAEVSASAPGRLR